MADNRGFETRRVSDTWPTGIRPLTMGRVGEHSALPEMATKKGGKVPVRLEFEQRFLLDPRKSSAIRDELCEPWKIEPTPSTPIAEFANPKPGITVCHIRQFYDNGDRYRHTGEVWGYRSHVAAAEYVKEKKKSLYLGTTYSANSEEEEAITHEVFREGWDRAERRLQKMRFQVPSVHPEHRTVVDFFYTLRDSKAYVYAVSAEDEALLDYTTRDLFLQFELPIYLQQYSLCTVDSSNPDMKMFRSANMIDTPESIDAFERAISQWYESV